MAASPFPASPVVPETFGADREIRFRCRKGIACWNACCSDIDIALTPYDVVRLKRRLGLDSSAFLREFTVPYEMEKDGLAGVKLKPVEGGTACRFMGTEGCAVYDDRPTACRYYPLALLSMRREGESTDSDAYALVKEPHCLGHQEPRRISVADYRREQGLEDCDALARGWRQLVLKKKSAGPAIGTPSKSSLELFFMACYDLDRFRAFVSSAAFDSVFDLPADEKAAALADDVQMLQFAFRFLRQVLFGEVTVALRSGAAEERRGRIRARAAELEREAAGRLAAEEEGHAQPD